jgi:circadian clock protein KaiB
MEPREDLPETAADVFKQETAEPADAKYVLRLYISGMTARSTQAITNLATICHEYLKSRYELEIVDIYKHPEAALSDHVIATPTLVRKLPLPFRSLVGTLADEERVLAGLDLIKK